MIKTFPQIKGSAFAAGLKNRGRISLVEINSTEWLPLPEFPLENRNAISIQNESNTDIKIQYDPTVEDFKGVTIAKGTERFYQITDDIKVYARSQNGTVEVTVEELS